MTTVINFNFLNFFRLKLNNSTTADDGLSHNRHLYSGRQNYPRQQSKTCDVIDVTPYSCTSTDNYDDNELRTGDNRGRAIYFSNPLRIENLYDRKGKTVQCADEKGLLFNLYV